MDLRGGVQPATVRCPEFHPSTSLEWEQFLPGFPDGQRGEDRVRLDLGLGLMGWAVCVSWAVGERSPPAHAVSPTQVAWTDPRGAGHTPLGQ